MPPFFIAIHVKKTQNFQALILAYPGLIVKKFLRIALAG
jgi:hypothetical protein